jgi:hypothetical protein
VPTNPLFDTDRHDQPPSVGSAEWLLRQCELIGRLSSKPITANVAMSLRREHGQQAASLLMTIATNQTRATDKFGPGIWMANEKSIAQATDRVVADYKASLFGNATVFDLCSGIGGDAMELAKRGPVVAVDIDPQMVAMAMANLCTDSSRRGQSMQDTEAICADATQLTIPPDAAIHIDPDRRPQGTSRVVQPSSYLPSIDAVDRLVGRRPSAVVKLAPAAQLDQDAESASGRRLVEENHRQWISLDGSVREQALLCGSCISAAEVQPGGRSAVRLWADGYRERFAVDACQASTLPELDRSLESVDDVPPYLIDLDPAVRAAGLSSSIAIARRWVSLGGPSGFFGCDTMPEDQSLAQVFETIWSGPADLKRIKRWIQSQEMWVESVKVRGTGQDPEVWVKALRGSISAKSAGHVVVIIGRHNRGTYAAIAHRQSDRATRKTITAQP